MRHDPGPLTPDHFLALSSKRSAAGVNSGQIFNLNQDTPFESPGIEMKQHDTTHQTCSAEDATPTRHARKVSLRHFAATPARECNLIAQAAVCSWTILSATYTSGLAGHRSSNNAVGIHTHEQQRVLTHNIYREIERACGTRLRVDGERVGLCPVAVKDQAAADRNIEHLRGGRKIVQIHQAAEAAR